MCLQRSLRLNALFVQPVRSLTLLNEDLTKRQWRKRWFVDSLLFLTYNAPIWVMTNIFKSMFDTIVRIPSWTVVHKKNLHFSGTLDFHIFMKGKLSSIAEDASLSLGCPHICEICSKDDRLNRQSTITIELSNGTIY